MPPDEFGQALEDARLRSLADDECSLCGETVEPTPPLWGEGGRTDRAEGIRDRDLSQFLGGARPDRPRASPLRRFVGSTACGPGKNLMLNACGQSVTASGSAQGHKSISYLFEVMWPIYI